LSVIWERVVSYPGPEVSMLMTAAPGISFGKPDAISCDEISDPAVMNRDPLVSVHMITFNHEPYIARAIEGVLMQERDFPIELVIGEDCSTDGTCEIVLRYQKKHPETIRVLTSERNVGAVANELRTDRACRGKYVAFCEGDDRWHHPLKLQKQVDYLESHPEVGLVFGAYDRFYVETGRLEQWRPTSTANGKRGDKFTMMLDGEYPCPLTCTVCMRRDLYQSIRENNPDNYSDEFPMTDTQTWLEAARVSGIERINESLATHNILPESLAQSKDAGRRIRFAMSDYRLLLHIANKHRCSAETIDRIHERCNDTLLRLAFESSDPELASCAARKLREAGGDLTLGQKLYLLGASKRELNPPIGAIMWAKRMLGDVRTKIRPRN
jgi:glycosyltransferase involved in cell wall biosynthesis